jgi:hypothetical protein
VAAAAAAAAARSGGGEDEAARSARLRQAIMGDLAGANGVGGRGGSQAGAASPSGEAQLLPLGGSPNTSFTRWGCAAERLLILPENIG